jgi:Tol biopolymer transport system component
MTDERMDALIRRLDATSHPDPEFARSTYAALLPRARAARAKDATWIGRVLRDLRLTSVDARRSSAARPLGVMSLVVLLILATIMVLVIVGSMNRSIQNGPLIVSIRGELQAVDPLDGSARKILPPGESAHGVSRSPDGRLVTFWTIDGARSRLWVIGVDGQHRRELAPDLSLGWDDAIDVWSSDSRFLATGTIIDGGITRIVVVDVETGSARVVTPSRVAAHDPLWSPDDRWIAFGLDEDNGHRSLAVIRADGSDWRRVGKVVDIGGPDTWSLDGVWIYFGDTRGRLYRANVAGGTTQRLSADDLVAFSPASSPDGTLIAFIVNRNNDHWDLYAANSDGTNPHRLLEYAENDGWSADSRYVLAQWNPLDQPGGLAVVKPDGSEFRVVVPFDALCDPRPGGPRSAPTASVGANPSRDGWPSRSADPRGATPRAERRMLLLRLPESCELYWQKLGPSIYLGYSALSRISARREHLDRR